MKSLFRAVALGALLATSAMTLPAAAQETVAGLPIPNLTLSATGEIRVAPDMATISLGVMTEAKTAQEAMRQNAARMSGVIAALRAQGIAERDVQTSNINLNAQYRYVENKPPELTGYQASNTVTIRVMDLARIGQALDAVVSVGANQIHGISFGLKEPAVVEDAARRKAVQALRSKADLYAEATRCGLMGLLTLSENGGYSAPPPMPMMVRGFAKAEDASTPVSGGQIAVRIDITGVYQIACRLP